MLHAWANGRGVPLLDLTAEMSSKPLDVVYQDGIHLRPEGDQIVADAIARKWDWPPSRPASRPAR
jgi:lysophospholipase L1-like esterase